MFAFERLEAWHACHELSLAIYRVTASWPAVQRFGLTAQVQRAAVSVEANIAEGSAKRGGAEFRRYLDIALGSLSELACLPRLTTDPGMIPGEELANLNRMREKASKLTWRLCQLMSRRPSDRPTV